MKKQTFDYDFAPQNIVVGMFGDNNGFVTCNYKFEKWMNATVFERLCKFKPYEQRSAETQLKKAIANAVQSFENLPTDGFSLVNFKEDMYNFCVWNSSCYDVTLHDPRGFNISVTASNFWHMLESSGFNIKDGVVNHKFAYAWKSDSSRFMLVDAESDKFKQLQAMTEVLKNKQFLQKKQLVPGKIYKGTEKFPGMHMYIGEMPVYKVDYHENALQNLVYSQETYVKRNSCLDKALVFVRTDCENPYENTFEFKTSVNKLLESEVDFDLSNSFSFIDCTKPISFESVLEYIKTSILFNKIDFSNIAELEFAVCPKDLFIELMNATCDDSAFNLCKFFPFSLSSISDIEYYIEKNPEMQTHFFDVYKTNISFDSNFYSLLETTRTSYQPYNPWYRNLPVIGSSKQQYWFLLRRYSSSFMQTKFYVNAASYDELYDLISPKIARLKFQNGEDVPLNTAIFLQRCLSFTKNQ